jgi:outer membrane lipoprotein LolB
MSIMPYRRLWLLVILALLQACTQLPRQLDVDQQLQNQLRQVAHWQAAGKLGVRISGDAHGANFDWHHQPDSFVLRLSGPFGQGTTWLRREGRWVTLESPDHPLTRATSAEHLMQEQLGWQVPVSNLRHWIKGVAAPKQRVESVQYNEDGTLAELQQQGWTISYSRYNLHNGWALPGRVVARHSDIQLTLVIKSWDLNGEALPQTAQREGGSPSPTTR